MSDEPTTDRPTTVNSAAWRPPCPPGAVEFKRCSIRRPSWWRRALGLLAWWRRRVAGPWKGLLSRG